MANKKITFEYDIKGQPIKVLIDDTLNLKQAFRQLTQEVSKPNLGVKEFELLSAELGNVKDQLDKTNAKSRDFFSSLSLLPGPIGNFSSSVDGAIGTLKTFTSLSFKDLKFQLGETLNDFKDIAGSIGKATGITKIYTTLNNALAASFVKVGVGEQAAATGARAFSAALTATGIGALVLLLGAAASALMDYFDSSKKAEKAADDYADAIKRQNELLDDNLSLIDFQTKKKVLEAKLVGKSEEEITDITINGLKERLDKIKQASAETLKEETDLFYKQGKYAKISNEERTALLAKNTENRIKLQKDENKAREALELEELQAQVDKKKRNKENSDKELKDKQEQNKKLLEAERQRIEKIREENEKASQLLSELQSDNRIKSIEDERKRQDQELKELKEAEERKVYALQISEELKGKIVEEIRKKYELKQKETDKKRKEEDGKNLKDAQDFLNNLRIQAMMDQNKKEKEEAKKQYDDDIERLNKLHEQKLIDGTEYRIGVFDAEQILRNKLRAIDNESLQDLKKTEDEKVDIKMQTLDQIMLIADKETTIGRAAIVLRAILQAKELAMEIKNTIAFSKLSLARSKAAVAEGTAKTAKVGFPQNIPLLIGYAAQAAAIISAITSAVSSANSVASEAASGGSEGQNLGRNYEKGGMIEGPRHAQGGVIIEAEGGEAIMSRGSVTMFRPLLSMLNQMGGGTSFSPGAIGGSRPDAPLIETPSLSQSPQIIKTYVVSNELTTEAERQAKLKDLSTL